jgi:hypothetical protein
VLHTRLNALASLQGTGDTKPWRSSSTDTNDTDGTDIAYVAETWWWYLPADPFNLVKEYELQVYVTLTFLC